MREAYKDSAHQLANDLYDEQDTTTDKALVRVSVWRPGEGDDVKKARVVITLDPS